MKSPKLPERIICLTEESVEMLYLLGQEHRIVGVSQYAVRPERVKREKPVVSVFTHSNFKKVLELNPDLIIGYSDIQKDIAREFIEAGQNVWIANHRSLDEVKDYCFALGSMVGAGERALEIIEGWNKKIIKGKKFSEGLERPLSVYIEEWDDPRISAIRYFSELVELCGGENILKSLSYGNLAKERMPDDRTIIEADPEIILGCWCGKKVDIASFASREGWSQVRAIKEGSIHELPPEVFLQPGPALFESGIDYLIKLFTKYQ